MVKQLPDGFDKQIYFDHINQYETGRRFENESGPHMQFIKDNKGLYRVLNSDYLGMPIETVYTKFGLIHSL